MNSTSPSTDQFVDVLRNKVLPNSQQLELLRLHYATPQHRVTPKELGKKSGMGSGNSVNSMYGHFATQIRHALGISRQYALSPLIEPASARGPKTWILRSEVAAALVQLGWVESNAHLSPEESEATTCSNEGHVMRVLVNRYERDPENRHKCFKAHGTKCYICAFDFGSTYGPDYELCVHAHHLVPLSQIKAQHEVNPVRDMRPVCPNCHAVLHRGDPLFEPDDVRTKLRGCEIKAVPR